MPDPKRVQPSGLRFAGVGFEFVAAVCGFAAVGYWIDHHYGSKPWGLVIGAGLGVVGGTYNLLRETAGAFGRPSKRKTKMDRDRPEEP